MKILYVTRHFNHSGYIILKRLIDDKIPIYAVLVKEESNIFKTPLLRHFALFKYWLKIKFYKGQFLKTTNSEELLAKNNGLRIIKTSSIKSDSFFKKLQEANPDLIVLGGGWPELIPERVYSYPRFGCINTHPSLLPEYRGTSITRWQVLNGVLKSGSTIHFVDSKFDTGGAIAQVSIDVNVNWTPQELFLKLGEAGADIMADLLKNNSKEFKPKTFFPKHNPAYYKYFSKWKWDPKSLVIDWTQPLIKIHFFVLANSQESYEYLGPMTKLNNALYFVRQTKLYPKNSILPKNFNEVNYNPEEIFIFLSKDKKLYLGRKNEEWVIELMKIQSVSNYKWKRSFNPSEKSDFISGKIFNYENL